MEYATRITLGQSLRGLSRAFVLCAAAFVTACTQGPGGGGIGLASGQDPDPATVDFPIFYIRHQIPEEQDNVTRLRPFVEDDDYSATLWKRDRASPGSPETEITARLRTEAFGGEAADRFDVKDLTVSPTGLQVAFAMRGPLDDADEEEDPPTWNIWEYDIGTDTLRRVIASNIIAEEGQDVSPAYLPDGRIVFSSTRQRQSKAILLDEGKAQFEAANEARSESTFVLHVMNADGTNIHQITFNQSTDQYATVLQNGRILYTRWDRAQGMDALNLYTTNPDGTDTQLHYGSASHATGIPRDTADPNRGPDIEFTRAREMSDGRLMVLTRQRTDVDFGGTLQIVDATRYVENTQPVLASAGATGPAQTPATLNVVYTIPGPSPGGRFQSGFPLWDGSGRILVSWSQCRLLDAADPTRIVNCSDDRLNATPAPTVAPPLYSIWMFQPSTNTILPVMSPVEGVMVTEALAAQPRVPLPTVILDKQAPVELDADLVSEGAGLLSIRSVYDITGEFPARSAANINTTISSFSNPSNAAYGTRSIRFIRIDKLVSLPDDDDIADPDNSALGGSNVMREIVAYAPVEPDGSVRMKVPANIAFQLSLLDANGRRIGGQQHRSWLSLRPGEIVECNGCHARQAQGVDSQNRPLPPLVHGRKDLFTPAYAGSTATGAAFPGTVNTISPDAGDTMARARSRAGSSCIDPTTMVEHCGLQSVTPSANVVYNEIWRPAAPPTDSFAFTYQNLTTAIPASVGCFPVWTATCRITIHYATIGTRAGHIHPLWAVPRPLGGVDDGAGNISFPQTCTNCHSRVNPADPAMAQLPAASLELTDEVSDEDALQLRAFRHMLFPRPELELVMGAVQQRLVPEVDANGNPVLDDNGNPVLVPVTLSPPMLANNSRGSRFFTVMNNPTHAGMLTTAELRLLSEWLDIGAQYYNDPFPPTPQN